MIAAHIDDTGNIQSVREHCENTAAYASENGKKSGLEYTMYLAGLLHDIGKNTEKFDNYIHTANFDKSSFKKGEKINHSSAGAKYLNENIKIVNKFDLIALQLICYAIISHHGLSDCLTYDGEDKYSARIKPATEIYYSQAIRNSEDIFSENDINALFRKSSEEVKNILSENMKISQKMTGSNKYTEEVMFLQGCLQRFVLSMLIDADRHDTAEFMNNIKYKRLSSEESSAYFEECLKNLEIKLKSFEAKNNIDILRKEMSEQCAEFAKNNGNGIYKLSIPTGGGKTYSSMRYALNLAIKEKKEKIIYTAPFLSILEQNASDLKKVFGESENILEHHSNVLFDENEDNDNIKRYELFSDDWSSPIILTTMVRFLDVLFGGKSGDIRRMNQLKNSVIIIDEAQSVPVKYINLFNTMVNFLSRICNSTIVMCTATQPIFEKTKRPLLYSENSNIILDIEKYSFEFKRAEIITDYAMDKLDTESLSELVSELTERNSLIILNTKSAVQKLYDGMKEIISPEYKLIQLTTYMCAQHRLDLIEEMKTALKNKEKLICISTQLIEAGVDISFETVFRSLSGLDSIAQAAGRCNRNAESENNGKTYIIQYAEENVSSLEDIKQAQDSMMVFLNKEHNDLLMPESIQGYYEQYFLDRENINDCPLVKYNKDFDSNQTMYALLASNYSGMREYKKINRKPYPMPFMQAYKTAASFFAPIEDKNTIGVIVYYGKSKEIINKLYKTDDFKETKKLLRSLQRYTVDMTTTSKKFRELKETSAFENSLFDSSLLILTESYYDKKVGVKSELSSLIL